MYASIARPRQIQSGAILVITMMILIAMTLASVGLMRSVDTAQLLSGNIGFKRDATNRAMLGLQGVTKQLTASDFLSIAETFCQTSCPSSKNDRNYSPRLLETNSSGIPTPLTNVSTFDSKYAATNQYSDTTAYVTTRYLIERMCSDYNAPSQTNCVLDGAVELDCPQPCEKPGVSPFPFFRITVRADGPRNTVAYAQAIVSLKQN